jgi:integrase
VFVLSCYTGLRFSDWGKYTPENIIEGGRLLKVMTFKTGELVVIPLSTTAREILNRYQGTSFRLPSNVKMNKTLKVIGQLAEMHQTMNVSSTSGGIVMTVLRMKWELITTHTARRSFATNAFLSGIPTISIMKITGHRTERSFLKYIRVSQLENAIKMAEHPFFK